MDNESLLHQSFSLLERVLARQVLDGHPVLGREFLHDPLAAETSEPAVLLSTEGHVWPIVHSAVVDVCHSGFKAQRKRQRTSAIARAHGAGQAVLGIVRHI